MKKCNQCKATFALSFFCKASKSPDGHQYTCKECHKANKRAWFAKNKQHCIDKTKQWRKDNPEKFLNARLKNYYGISLDDYKKMAAKQNDCCAICGEKERRVRRSRMAIDHCHKTGVVRGLLCNNCNIGIGNLKDDPIILMKAVSYLWESYANTASL